MKPASRLKLTGGHARGRLVPAPVVDGVRPTSARVREALFSALGQDLSGMRFFDAFGGSGVMAFEAWSRGAEVVVCERDPRQARAIREAAQEMGAKLHLEVGDTRVIAPSLGRFDIVFADPPYADDPSEMLGVLAAMGAAELVLEADGKRLLMPVPTGYSAGRRYDYGGSALWRFQRAAS